MPWFMPWSESIKKRACRYLLQRYLGQFFEEKLTLDQLSVDLYNGTGTVADISLDVQALNELGEQQNWPMEFVDGYVEQMSISVPWSALLKESSNIEVRGLNITIQPKQRSESGTSMFESMWSSMTSSMQLAQDCLKQESPNSAENAQPLEGIERFAQTIDSILCRVKVKFINTVIRFEHVPKDCSNGVALQINIQNMEYLDEAGNDPPRGQATELNTQDHNKAYIISSFTTKKFYLEGVRFATDEFPSKARTFSRSVMCQSQFNSHIEPSKITDDEFLNTIIDDAAERNKKTSDSEYFMSCTDIDTEQEQEQEQEQFTPVNENEKGKLLFSHFEHEPILFGKLSGRQEIRLRLKQSEAIVGPKVTIDVTLGSFTLFLSPRQVHVLLELADGLASPHLEDTSNVPQRQRCAEKPMGDVDFQRIEQELQQQLNPVATVHSTGLQHTQGWSTAPLDFDDNDVDFLPMRNATMEDSTLSVSSSMQSSVSSSISSASSKTSSHIPSKSKRRVSNTDLDPSAEITRFQIRLASLAVVVLHEDLLSVSALSDQCLVPSSVTQMKHCSESFFNSLGLFAVTGYGNKDFEKAKAVFEKACQLNHIRLLAAPIQIEGDEKTTVTSTSIAGNLTAAKLELLECLWNENSGNVEYVQLLTFNDDSLGPIGAKPCLKVAFKHSEKVVKTGRQTITYPKTDLQIQIDNALTEIDISIVDRICALLNPQPVCLKSGSPLGGLPDGAQTAFNQATDLTALSEYRYDIKVMSPLLTIKLRFPVPDFRPAHDMQRSPWWKRNVRPDYVTLSLTDANVTSSIHSKQPCLRYELQSRMLDVHYTEADSSVPLHIGRVSLDEKTFSSLPDGFNWLRIVMEIYPAVKTPVQLEEGGLESETEAASFDSLTAQGPRNPSPFSAKRIVHESDTPHTKPHQEDTEELIIPGDRAEMAQFIEQTIHSSQIRLDVFLPTVSLQLMSKHIYELLYNRINTDLLLWEPSAPKAKVNSAFDGTALGGCDLQESIYPTFSMCKSGIQYESESESEEEQEDTEGVFYSLYESKNPRGQKRTLHSLHATRGQSFLCLNMHIAQGILCMHSPARDSSSNVIPEQHGEFVFLMEDASVFTVSQFMGNPDLSYVCVQGRTATLHHCDLSATPSLSPPLREIGSTLPRHLNPTIYTSEPGVLISNTISRAGDRDQLSVAVRIQASHETHHVKTIRVAVGVKKATLRHRMCVEPNSWFSQLVDFFDVLDYPVPGYVPMGVLTELHLHLWDCVIDYRPMYLPLRSVLTLGSFSMSSHLTAQANTSTLRFIAEDCGMFLSDRSPPKAGVPSLAPVDLRKDYVSVLDLSLFELSLRLSDKVRGLNPHVDLRASNNVLHIRTCADTGRALMQLITYFAGDGDLVQLTEPMIGGGGSAHSTPRKSLLTDLSEQLLDVDQVQDISNLSRSQHEHVNDLLGEAMTESLAVQTNQSQDLVNSQLTGVDVFFFPDENQPLLPPVTSEATKPITPIILKRVTLNLQSNKSSDTDEEFCFVGDEAGLGIMPKSGLPDIRWLTDDPVRIIDNHFTVPIGKTDLLKPPKHFPVAVLRYTLCEMTLIWHMYGGYDFKSTGKDENKLNKKTVAFSDVKPENLDGGATYSKVNPGEVSFTKAPEKRNQNLSWQIKGGVARDHDVLMELQLNKVRFQHEVYPDDTVQASRQVLLVSEVEIRDRLASSHFNKFLYQHTSQQRPKQSHANMIVIKATHIRPDPKLSAQECCLRVSLLPLRLNIDQDSLLFLINFFNELGGNVSKSDDEGAVTTSRHVTPTHQPPVMTVSGENEAQVKEQAQKLVSDNLLILLEEDQAQFEENKIAKTVQNVCEDSPPIYFRNVVFSPEVPIRLDYQGKRVDMTHGPLAGLLMGLGQLNCSELHLKRLTHRHGLLGMDKLLSYALHEWLQDIKKHQLPSLLGGFGPMHSFVQLFQGIRDLFWLPIEQYQKDGRLVRGLQRGANSFTTSTAMAALELTSKIIHLIQATAETAYDMVSPGPSVRRRPKGHKGRRRHYNQPQDIREGMANAYMVVKEGIGETADNIVRVASQEHEQKGYSGAVGGVLRQIPPTFVKPIIIASEATNNVLGGMRSQLVPDARREANQKWRNADG